MTALPLPIQRRIDPRRETVHHKPTVGIGPDGEFYWGEISTAHWRDEQGRQHDRPLLTALDLSPSRKEANNG